MSEQKPQCPNCKSNDLAIERRPDGNAICRSCGWQGYYKECFALHDHDIDGLIEIKALNEAQLALFRQHLGVAIEALKFYADIREWEELSSLNHRVVCPNKDISMEVEADYSEEPFPCGGKIAREALRKIYGV